MMIRLGKAVGLFGAASLTLMLVRCTLLRGASFRLHNLQTGEEKPLPGNDLNRTYASDIRIVGDFSCWRR
jgi:hypothetical protein